MLSPSTGEEAAELGSSPGGAEVGQPGVTASLRRWRQNSSLGNVLFGLKQGTGVWVG